MDSQVERRFLARTGQRGRLPEEHVAVVVVDNFPSLGTLTAVRFLEWVQQNPGGVVALPTGKTPQYFIEEVQRFLRGWQDSEVAAELAEWGLDPSHRPDMGSLRFVQIDEFYPIDPGHTNSFHHYVRRYYLDGFGIDPAQAQLIDGRQIGLPGGMRLEDVWGPEGVDLTLRHRHARGDRERLQQDVLYRVDGWCADYERRIRDKGGIGFFLGGIGPDGHIAFNVRGTDPYSTTRLCQVNYETLAASATDLGGIEVARRRLVITIGLATITWNPSCVAIVMAAGEAKARVLAQAIEGPTGLLAPATALRPLQAARFYLTRGAAKQLRARRLESVRQAPALDHRQVEQIVIDIALRRHRRLTELTEADLLSDDLGRMLHQAGHEAKDLADRTRRSVLEKIRRGMEVRRGKRFLHTEPHHDDVMLGYLPLVVRHIRDHSTHHHFATFTSGFTAVTNGYMLSLCDRLRDALRGDSSSSLRRLAEAGYFDADNRRTRDHDVWVYLDGLAAASPDLQEEGTLRRFYRDLAEVYGDTAPDVLAAHVEELIDYFRTQYPGKKDLPHIQTLKGMCREWESACLWGFFGWNSASVEHLRLGFYQGDVFTEDPSVPRDVMPVLALIRRVAPDVITVAFDPEASGPDTHYKVLQSIAEALKIYREESGRDDLEVIGYRNVWYRFHPAEADIFVPVSLNMLTLQHNAFMNTYISQKEASFPSPEYEGPFSLLAQKIQVEQYEDLATLLGHEYFYEHESALVRATRGFVFVRSMSLDEFFAYSRDLRHQAETRA